MFSASRLSRARGVGAKCVNAVSEWFEAEVRRDGKIHQMRFSRQLPGQGEHNFHLGRRRESLRPSHQHSRATDVIRDAAMPALFPQPAILHLQIEGEALCAYLL